MQFYMWVTLALTRGQSNKSSEVFLALTGTSRGDYVKLNVKTQTILTNICFQNIYFIVTTTKHCGNKN